MTEQMIVLTNKPTLSLNAVRFGRPLQLQTRVVSTRITDKLFCEAEVNN